MIRTFGYIVVLVGYSGFAFSQLSQDWAMSQLLSYSSTGYDIVNQFHKNGRSISYGGNSTSSSMHHLELCELKDVKSFLNSISTTVHETTHAFDSQIPYMRAKQGENVTNLSKSEGFYINEFLSYSYNYPSTKLFPSIELAHSIPESLQTLRYKTYIMAQSLQSTQSSGIIGLMEEFNAYYQGSKVIYDLYPLFQQEYTTSVYWEWPTSFISNADAFYEFDFFIKEYLLYAKTNHPELYEELYNDYNFRTIYQTVRKQFKELITQYEKKYDVITKTKYGGVTTNKHSEIYTVLSMQIESERYQVIVSDFLGQIN
jgi:hypothetical protein